MSNFIRKKKPRSNSLTNKDKTFESPEKIFEKLINFKEPLENEYSELSEEPMMIKSSYKDDFNLIMVHNLIIRSKIIFQKRKIKSIDREIYNINNEISLSSNVISPINLKMLNLKLDELLKEKNLILNGQIWERYSNKVRNILLEYIEVMPNENKGIIYVDRKHENVDKEVLDRRFSCINNYISVIKELNIIELNIIQEFDE